ncbi:RuvB ATP-dependent DNA helicase pontin [Conglomerata obtusa]
MSTTNNTVNILIKLITQNKTPPKIFSIPASLTSFLEGQVPSTSIYSPKELINALNTAIRLKIKEIKDVYEGEVVDFDTHTQSTITLKSLKSTKQIKIHPSIRAQVLRENIRLGDIVYIESNSGIVKRLGRSEAYVQDCALECERYVPVPKGEVKRRREIWQNISLNDLHASMYQNKNEAENYFSQLIDKERIKKDIYAIVREYVQNGNCEIIRGILFIYNSELLSASDIALINKKVESGFCPFIFLVDSNVKGFKGVLRIENDFEVVIERKIEDEKILVDENVIKFLNEKVKECGNEFVCNVIDLAKNNEELKMENVVRIFNYFQAPKNFIR